jgi:hypothetical protein
MQQKADKKTGMGLLIAAKIVLKQGKTGGVMPVGLNVLRERGPPGMILAPRYL